MLCINSLRRVQGAKKAFAVGQAGAEAWKDSLALTGFIWGLKHKDSRMVIFVLIE